MDTGVSQIAAAKAHGASTLLKLDANGKEAVEKEKQVIPTPDEP